VKRLMILILAACTALLVVGLSNAAAAPTTVTCTDAFSGTAFNVVVPDDNFCVLSGATITHDLLIGVDAGAGAGVEAGESGLTVGHDVTMQHDSEVDFGATVIGHDLIGTTNDAFHLERDSILGDLLAFQPATVQTGGIGPETPGGPVHVLGDLLIQGTPPDNDFVFDGLGGGLLTVGRDLRITDRSVTLGFTVGGDTVGRDLIVTNDSALSGFFGPSSIVVSENSVGRDLIFTGNTAVPGGDLIVSHNVVGRDAICAANDPPPTDGNVVGRTNTCG
jgi:hypothetical protein